MKKSLAILTVIVLALLYWGFLEYTGSEEFIKEDAAWDSPHLSLKEQRARCDKMSRFSYVSGLTDGAFVLPPFVGRTYYYKSDCYQELARKTLDSKLCTKVVERFSLFGQTKGVSKAQCLKQVVDGRALAKEQQAETNKYNASIFGAAKIINQKTQIEKMSQDSWRISISTEGTLFGEYEFQVKATAVNESAKGLLQKENVLIKDAEESFSWTITKSQLERSFACTDYPSTKREMCNLSVFLTLLKSDNNSFGGKRQLTSIGNISIVVDTSE